MAVERCTLDTCGLCGETVHSANVALAVAALMLDHKPFNSVFHGWVSKTVAHLTFIRAVNSHVLQSNRDLMAPFFLASTPSHTCSENISLN